MVEMMDNKKKTPGNRDDAPGKRAKVKILFYNYTRILGKKQIRDALAWREA